MSKLKSQVSIFLVLFVIVEIFLRIFGMTAGSAINDFKAQDDPEYVERFVSDEKGINHIQPGNSMLMPGTVINGQGFRGAMAYTPRSVDSVRKSTGKEIVMIIGDSYVEGCCADNVSNSFPDLINRSEKYTVLNFGVAGTDPLQYELVAKKYVALLKPDYVVVAIYFGNDISFFKRQPTPYVPLTFPFKDNKWIFQVAPDYLAGKANYSFKSEKEAYGFFVNNYTLKGSNRNVFEKAFSYSVIFSKIYLAIELKRKLWRWQALNKNTPVINGNEVTHERLKAIASICDSLKTRCLFVGIPAPKEAEAGAALKIKYQPAFKNITWFVPYNFTLKDYDGSEAANHFNNAGHEKYAGFVIDLLDNTKK